MAEQNSLLTSQSIEMLVASVTQKGTLPLREIEAERFLNALTRALSGVPTGAQSYLDEKSH